MPAPTATDRDASGTLDQTELSRTSTTTSNSWQAKARYDRFFTLNNSAYASAQALSDKPAGKQFVGGGQAGYSRQLVKTDRYLAVAELGYDFSYEKATGPTAEGVPIHSGRAFTSAGITVSKQTGATLSLEVLTNLNKENAPAPGYAQVDGFKDTRFVGKLGLTTTLWENVSFGFGFTGRYDNAPAPLPALKTPALPFAPGFFPLAKKWDTITEATLIVTFL
jgi:hypothetical protein